MANVVVATGVVRRYGERRALAGLDLVIPEGAAFGLLGPNGSGKSTFISLLAAMQAPDEGQITVFGQGPAPGLRAQVGTVFQENAQDPLMSPAELLALAGRVFGLDGATTRTRSAELLRRFDLADRAREPISGLSGGMRRRLEAARALLHEPRLLLLDEPTTGVDPGQRQALWAALQATRAERTILLATNDLLEADAVCDQVAFLRDGLVVASGTPQELKAGLRSETVRIVWEGEATPADLAAMGELPGAGDVSAGDGGIQVSCDSASDLVARLFAMAPKRIRGIRIHAATLEDAYFRYTGARIGDEVRV